MYAITRVDHASSGTHSWLVRLQRRHHMVSRHFSDAVYGSKRKALRAALHYRDQLMITLRPMSRQTFCAIKKKNNRTGISGVTRVDVLEKSRGRIYRRIYWDVQWPIGNGQARHKKFSVKKYGERGAFLRAFRVRQQALKALH